MKCLMLFNLVLQSYLYGSFGMITNKKTNMSILVVEEESTDNISVWSFVSPSYVDAYIYIHTYILPLSNLKLSTFKLRSRMLESVNRRKYQLRTTLISKTFLKFTLVTIVSDTRRNNSGVGARYAMPKTFKLNWIYCKYDLGTSLIIL